MKYIAPLLVAYANHALAQTQIDKEKYSRFAAEADLWGYTWEAFEVTTDDDYILTTFHITGDKEPFTERKESILVQHGHLQDAASWLHGYVTEPPLVNPSYTPGKPMAFQLADSGYDIWLGNNRGTEYSQGHKTLSAVDDHEYWLWTWAEMGLYDDTANITFIKEHAKQEKIFYIGYSQGTVQMFYGLSHIEESFLEDNLIKFIALAPCSISTGVTKKDGSVDHSAYEGSAFHYHELGIYNIMGPNWDKNLKTGCDTFGEKWCSVFSKADVQPYGTQDEWHWDYNFIQQRFQEFAPDYQKGVVHTALIPLESIDKVPIAMIAATNDPTCPYKTAEHMRDIIPSVKQFFTIPDEDHTYFGYASDDAFMAHVHDALDHINGDQAEIKIEFLN